MKAQPSASKEKLTVRPLTSEDWPLLEALFGANGACGGCWCMWWRVPRGGKLWDANKGDPNKKAFKKLVTSGAATGCLALAGDQPVGWCSVGPRAVFPRLDRVRGLATDWDEHTWCVNCFFIKAGWRGRGVASKLLTAAVRLAREQGARRLEGYPVHVEGDRQMPAAFAWTGVPALFERARFQRTRLPGATRDVYVKRL